MTLPAEVEAVSILLRKSNNVPSRFLVTEGTVHGFASRPNPESPQIMKAYQQANDLIVEWAKTHLSGVCSSKNLSFHFNHPSSLELIEKVMRSEAPSRARLSETFDS